MKEKTSHGHEERRKEGGRAGAKREGRGGLKVNDNVGWSRATCLLNFQRPISGVSIPTWPRPTWTGIRPRTAGTVNTGPTFHVMPFLTFLALSDTF